MEIIEFWKIVSLALIWIGYYALHSLLASTAFKRRLLAKWPNFGRHYRLTYNAVAILTLGAGFLWQRQLAIQSPLELPAWSWMMGAAMILVGSVLMKWAMRGYNLREFAGLDSPRHSGGKLYTGGMNAWVRHPLYFAGIWILMGAYLVRPSGGMAIFVAISLIYLIIGTKWEERKLIDEFGDEYLQYQRKVKMLIPYIF
ncbi:isoprenylcysteine carboxylmethyltransferase family protein [Pontibacter sp. G13]|uniref:methyltransferase family protein n=1 Tax=Pontibacter sp. G13 TaxID=3074898 RepID=UPI002889A75C|nr:isoprenylcysteine carboxylmethyltransferase family protein [Pontibacter sp. G13]WNJ16552.1 isoprenylcysteine carboxylmethyltransferase family protein [Pontibacter sp. G13]